MVTFKTSEKSVLTTNETLRYDHPGLGAVVEMNEEEKTVTLLQWGEFPSSSRMMEKHNADYALFSPLPKETNLGSLYFDANGFHFHITNLVQV